MNSGRNRVPGKPLRRRVSRASFGSWRPAEQRSPLSLLEEQDRQRAQELLPLRRERMSVSPFTFYRGSAILMASDLATAPVTGIEVQVCGDAHISNFGVYASPERRLVFDVNDFDETARGPWEWDVLRMATSVLLAARENGFRSPLPDDMVRGSVKAYRQAMRSYANMSPLQVWYETVNLQDIVRGTPAKRRAALRQTLARGKRRTGDELLPKLTSGDPPRFVDRPPAFRRIGLESEFAAQAEDVLRGYQLSLPDNVRSLFDRYTMTDAAWKVVGVGSVGTRCLVSLHFSECGAPLLLQIKEAGTSVITRFTAGEEYANQGERVVRGQRLMQTASDIFLGWTRSHLGDYYVRQLRDMKISANLAGMSPNQLARYGAFCAETLARAHARSGDPTAIADYLGTSPKFDRAVARFARTYATVAQADYELFTKKGSAAS
jgi:uncharacterized protein (DUF2252 family)